MLEVAPEENDIYLRVLHPPHQHRHQPVQVRLQHLVGWVQMERRGGGWRRGVEEKGGWGKLRRKVEEESGGVRTSLQMGCSARESQNSQASRATPSSGSWGRVRREG